jgi:hypothetical protein
MAYTLTLAEPLMRVEFGDTITAADLEEMSAVFSRLVAAGRQLTRRVTVLTAVTRLEIGFEQVYALAQRRLARTAGHRVQSALVAATPAQMGIARMFQTLNDHPLTSVRIFPDLASALAAFDEDES